MRNNIVLLSLVFLVIPRISKAQTLNANRKRISATRISKAPKIDGKINDDAWDKAEEASDFIMLRPDNGKTEPSTHKTRVKLVYDDQAIYVSAEMEAPDPSKIPAEFTNRDNIGNADFFLMTINPNDDGQNPFEFIVTSSGVQADAKISNGDEDFNWSAVWDSSVRFTEKAWIVEMKIPYRALRFANEAVQSWGINFHRRVQNLNAQFTWNHVDNQVGRWTQYDGLLENLKDIKPPTRLIFYPYASSTVKINKGKNDFDWSVGMDIKYGLTENFTLDATLIPDFGQVAFDNVVLNLGPFEQQFTEQRQFFTEGTELFNITNLFYSRRIGGSPIDQFDVKSQISDDEEIIDNPSKVDMLNAVKISGRTKKGLGIGFFNAITAKTEATVRNKTTNETRTLVTNPFSNYNILVLDQQFNQNSFVSLINTNVTRVGEFRDANTTGIKWHVEDKKSTYNIDGSFRMSHLSDDDTKPSAGYTFDTSIGKHAGNWRGEIGYNFQNKDFDPNDFGIFFRNNQQRIYGFLGYRLLQPKGIFNNYGVNFYYNVNFLHNPGTYVGANGGLSFWSETRKRFGFGGNLNFSTERKDFFEPRQGTRSGIYFKAPQRININHWGSTDYRKKFAVDYNWFYNFFKDNPKEGYGFRFAPRYRFSNRFSLVYGFRYSQTNRDQGYVRKISESYANDNPQYSAIEGDIIFGERDWTTYNNTLTGKYSFSALSSLSLSFRHNWSKVPYYDNNFYSLDETNGNLVASIYNEDHDRNFNSWNIDLNYVWQFAPGSQLIAFYRNSINPSNNFAPADISFADNLSRLFEQDMQHTFSLRLVYFIDYNNLKNIL
ncbi:DUF5916 domain-containing protein [Tenacibaculum xiamenense]|uniref:DUF5916 domain-containing protein n=1 Tax=Tenacibaculum xiamenense TaxID=1261553 RepID=UPI00389576B1